MSLRVKENLRIFQSDNTLSCNRLQRDSERLTDRAALAGARLAFGGLLLSVAACDASTPVEGVRGYSIVPVESHARTAAAGSAPTAPLQVQVRLADSRPARGVRIRFTVAGGTRSGGSLADTVGVTDADGVAGVHVTAGAAGDTLVIEAAIAFAPERRARMLVVAVPGPVVASVSPASVKAGDTVVVTGTGLGAAAAVRFGDVTAPVLAGATDALVRAIVPACLAPGAISIGVEWPDARSNAIVGTYVGARRRLAVQPYEFVTVPVAQLATCVELDGGGSDYLLAANFASVPAGDLELEPWLLGLGGTAATAQRASLADLAGSASDGDARAAQYGGSVRARFDAGLRTIEQAIGLQARAERRRAAARASASAGAQPPAIGSIRRFTVVSSQDGSSFETVAARLRHTGDHILLYTDTLDPGYSAGQLEGLAALMDRQLWAEAVSAFGAEPDIDANDRIIVLFTPVVNRMSLASECIQRGYVTGFFYPPDQLERHAVSNRAEIFYGLVPDASGRHSCPHSEADAVRLMQGTFLHEMQHLISFNEHVLARGGPTEETWLNEGLSHVAEELGSRLFDRRYPAPLGRSTTQQLFPDSAAPFIAPLLLNAYLYLNSPLRHSVTGYRGPGSIEDRGATWLFLRWLVDQKDGQVLRRLIQTPHTGVANLEAASGERFGALFGDFALALFADSLPGIPRTAVPARLRFSGRSLRQLMARQAVIAGFSDPFPLVTYLAAPGGSLRSSMLPGTMLHAIIPGGESGAPITFSFGTPELQPFRPALGAQLGILRLPQ